jgi:DNA-binding response OmpR family regulator
LTKLKSSSLKTSSSPLVVALVEDDRLLREEIVVHLQANGFIVHAVNSAAALDDVMAREAIDLYVLDLNLPGENGLSLSRRIRQSLPAAGIVIMTARVALQDRITGYQEGGADIYLSKPTAPDELVLILISLARRIKKTAGADEWSLRLRDRTLLGPLPGQKLRLTHREKTLLLALIQAKGRALSSGVLCDLYADDDSEQSISKHALEEMVARLRKKFKDVQSEGDEAAIKSVWGQGYELCLPINLA